MKRILFILTAVAPAICLCIQPDQDRTEDPSLSQRTALRRQTPPSGDPENPLGNTTERPSTLAGAPNGTVRLMDAQEFPMQILAESQCIDRSLRYGTTCCFFARGALNVLSGLLYATGGILLLLPGVLTDNPATLKLYNVFASLSVSGAVICRELAGRAQQDVVDNEREFAMIQAWRTQQQNAATPQESTQNHADEL
ncbi:MAG: FxsA family protein [Holosporales bacterium]|jgi:hypothetical protein|nr:FxsA family protein [Holosporales bacterium]